MATETPTNLAKTSLWRAAHPFSTDLPKKIQESIDYFVGVDLAIAGSQSVLVMASGKTLTFRTVQTCLGSCQPHRTRKVVDCRIVEPKALPKG